MSNNIKFHYVQYCELGSPPLLLYPEMFYSQDNQALKKLPNVNLNLLYQLYRQLHPSFYVVCARCYKAQCNAPIV